MPDSVANPMVGPALTDTAVFLDPLHTVELPGPSTWTSGSTYHSTRVRQCSTFRVRQIVSFWFGLPCRH